MGASSEYELIGRAVDYALASAEETETILIEKLDTSGSTVHVNGLRTLTMHSTIIAVGCFSVFEALLQQKKGWKKPFAEVDAMIRGNGNQNLADRFLDFRNAINALKHGEGQSYDRLIERKELLPFRVKSRNDRFFNEGDVAEGLRLVDADHAFVRQCSDIIEEVTIELRKIARA